MKPRHQPRMSKPSSARPDAPRKQHALDRVGGRDEVGSGSVVQRGLGAAARVGVGRRASWLQRSAPLTRARGISEIRLKG